MPQHEHDVPQSTADEKQVSRRAFVRGALYVAPALLTLSAVPAFAQNGSRPPANCRPGETAVWDENYGMWSCSS